MYDVYCHHCDRCFLVGARSVLSLHNTSEGVVAYVKCPNGHAVMRRFREAPAATTRSRSTNTGPAVPTVPLQPAEGALR